MGAEQEVHHEVAEQAIKPVKEFVVAPILQDFLHYTPEINPDLHMAAVTEQLVLTMDASASGYEAMRYQLASYITNAVITTDTSIHALNLFIQLDNTYQLSDKVLEIPSFAIDHLISRGNENPRPPHLQIPEPSE